MKKLSEDEVPYRRRESMDVRRKFRFDLSNVRRRRHPIERVRTRGVVQRASKVVGYDGAT